MWGNPIYFHRAKSIEQNTEKIQIWANVIEKILRKDKYWQKLLKINYEKLFKRSADHKQYNIS